MRKTGRIVVAICGPSGSGKSQLANALVATLGDDTCVRIPGDYFLAPAREPLDLALKQPLEYDWHCIEDILRQPDGATCETPLFDFDAMTRICETGGRTFAMRRIAVVDAMYPYPAANLNVLVTAPSEVRRTRIIERDRRWGARVIDRWDHLEIARRHLESMERSYDLVLDGTDSLSHNAGLIAAIVART